MTLTIQHNGITRDIQLTSQIQHLQFKDGSGWLPGRDPDPNDAGTDITDEDANPVSRSSDYVTDTIAVLSALQALHAQATDLLKGHKNELIKAKVNKSGVTPPNGQRFTVRSTPETVHFSGDTLYLNSSNVAKIKAEFAQLSRQ